MSFGLLLLAFVAVTNFARVGATLRRPDEVQISTRTLVAGCFLVSLACAVIASLAGAILDGLNVSPETFALAAAAVVAIMGLRVVLSPEWRELPSFEGLRAALIPIAIPLLFTPELAMLTITSTTRAGIGKTLAALLFALLLVLLCARGARRRERSSFVLSLGARALGALAVFTGVTITIDAIFDV